MTSWIISDLHLSAQRPAVTQAFLHWLHTTVAQAEALYILGDFFEVWVGDDVLDDAQHGAEFLPVMHALHDLSARGVKLYGMHGNRDFLIGQRFAQACGMQLLEDPTLLEAGNNRILLTHGDALCTDDVAYQAFRTQVRNPQWQHTFLRQPLDARIAFADQARDQSRQSKAVQSMQIMDVNDEAVAAMIRQHHYPDILLHGHTHRPAIHALEVDGHACQRWVLGDWHDTATVCSLDKNGLETRILDLTTPIKNSAL